MFWLTKNSSLKSYYCAIVMFDYKLHNPVLICYILIIIKEAWDHWTIYLPVFRSDKWFKQSKRCVF